MSDYTKFNFVNLQDPPLNAENLNIMDGQIFDNAEAISLLCVEDHNLEFEDPGPNGYYVRWGFGLQVCFDNEVSVNLNDAHTDYTSSWPVPFIEDPNGGLIYRSGTTSDSRARAEIDIKSRHDSSNARVRTGPEIFNETVLVRCWAIGRWDNS